MAGGNANTANRKTIPMTPMPSRRRKLTIAAGVSAEIKPTPAQDAEARNREDRLYADLRVQQLIDLPPNQRFKQVLEMSPQEQRALADPCEAEKARDFSGHDPKQKETLLAMSAPLIIVGEELAEAKLMRAIYS